MTAVKVGDRVRATCGESVIVGAVERVDNGGCYVNIESGDISLWLYSGDWTVEVLAPPIPDVVGTIVRDRDGDAWQRDDDGWRCVDDDSRYSVEKLQFCGPLTVLWTPEATP